MTVELALFLSSDGIALAHRQSAGHWSFIGDTGFDVPDLDKEMAKLRKIGEDRVGKDAATLLVLPDDQILYTSLTAPTEDPELASFRIEEGLEGLTPYAVSELVYDWRAPEPDRVKLAVVARETLDEARGFADGHGFKAAGFASVPPQERFPGVPLFDLGDAAKGLSFPEEGLAFGPDTWGMPDAADEASDAAASDAEAADEGSTKTPEEPTSTDACTEGEAAADAAAEPAVAKPAKARTRKSKSKAKKADDGDASAEADAKAAQPDASNGDAGEDNAAGGAAEQTRTDEPASLPEDAAPELDPEEALAAAASAEADATPKPADPLVLQDPALTAPVAPIDDTEPPGPADDVPTTPSAAVLAARNAAAAMEETPPPAFSPRGEPVPARGSEADGGAQDETAISDTDHRENSDTAQGKSRNPLAERLTRVRDASRPAEAAEKSLRPAPRRNEGRGKPVLPPGGTQGADTAARRTRLKGLSAVPTTSGETADPSSARDSGRGITARLGNMLGRRAPTEPTSSTTTPSTPVQSASAGTLTGPGRLSALGTALRAADAETSAREPDTKARSPSVEAVATTDANITEGLLGRNGETEEAPSFRTGLLLTIILLILLAAIAVWSALFLPDSPVARLLSGGERAETAALDLQEPPDAIVAPPVIGELASPGAPPGTLLDEPVTAADEAASDGVDLPDDAAVAPVVTVEPEAAPAITEDADVSPAVTVETADTTVAEVPPLAPLSQAQVPSLEETQALYEEYQIWPRPPDRPDLTSLDTLSDLGLSATDPEVASLDAIALPAPSLDPSEALRRVPPPPAFGTGRALTAADLTPATPEGVVTPTGVRVTAGTPPVLALRRPDAAAPPPPAPSFSIEDAILGTLRPTPRPGDLGQVIVPPSPRPTPTVRVASITPQPRSLPAGSQAASGAAAASLFPRAGTGDAAATATQAAVQRSIMPAARPANMETLVASATRVTPEVTVVAVPPAAAAPGPSIPSNASVSRAATQENELRLRQVNLIGVTGTASDRRALVRLPSGRFVRVGVGDRLNGGRVAAIGESTLQYVRSGRTVTLDIPG